MTLCPSLLPLHACMSVAMSLCHSLLVPFHWPMERGHSFLQCYSLVKPIPPASSPIKPHLSHSPFLFSIPPSPIHQPVKDSQSLAIQKQKNTVSDWFKLKYSLRPLSIECVCVLHLFIGLVTLLAFWLSNGKDKVTFFFFFPFLSSSFPHKSFYWNWPPTWLPVAKKLPLFPSRLPPLAHHSACFDTLGGEYVCCRKGVLWFWLVSLSTSVTMTAKIPMTSFSLALLQLQRTRLWLIGEEHRSWMDDARCIFKKGWRFFFLVAAESVHKVCSCVNTADNYVTGLSS